MITKNNKPIYIYKTIYLPDFKVALKIQIILCLFEQAPVENVINYLKLSCFTISGACMREQTAQRSQV